MKFYRTNFVVIKIYFTIIPFFFFISPQNIGADPLEVGALHFPPFYFVKSTKNVDGIMIDIVTEILKRASIDYVIRGYPPKRLYQNIADGNTDIWIGNKEVAVYKGKIVHSDFPIALVELRVYTIGNKKLPSEKEELRGKNMITISGYSYGGMIKFLENPVNNISTDPAGSHKTALLKLKAGRADYLLDYKYPISKELETIIEVNDLRYSTLFKVPNYIMVSKKTPNAAEILDRMEKAYHQLKKEGVIK